MPPLLLLQSTLHLMQQLLRLRACVCVCARGRAATCVRKATHV